MDRPWFKFYEKEIPRAIDYPESTIPDLLDAAASRFPDKIAVRFFVAPNLPAATMTYAQLRDATKRFATGLFQLGVRKGDRVGLMLPNCPQFIVAFYGILRLGAIAVNTNPLYVSREMKHQFADAGCETVILLNTFFPRLREVHAATQVRRVIVVDIASPYAWPLRQLIHLGQRKHGEYVTVKPQSDIFYFERLIEHYPPTPPGADLKSSDVALFQYSGGTTGIPKAAMLTHRNLVANTLQVGAWFTKKEEGKETFLCAIPFFHVYGMTAGMIFGSAIGAELVVIPRPRPVDNVLAAIQKTHPTIFPGVPTLYAAINNHPNVRDYDLRSIKFCISGAAPLPMEVAEQFERITGGTLVEAFGMSELSPASHCNPLYGTRKAGSIGVPLPDTDSKIVDMETGADLPPGKEGEMVVKGPQMMLGYWGRPEETANMIRDGWLHTGDVGKMDEDGFFYIVDRMKDMIAASGLKILPREVEEVLFMHPKVLDAVVAGVPDDYRGETVKAFIVLKDGVEASAVEIMEFCRLHMASFKVPTLVEFRKELPKTLVGKVLRRVLVEEERAKIAAAKGTGAQEKTGGD
jgi:long-chain acyl-CoA synthetase